jgi:hypothetical protein
LKEFDIYKFSLYEYENFSKNLLKKFSFYFDSLKQNKEVEESLLFNPSFDNKNLLKDKYDLLIANDFNIKNSLIAKDKLFLITHTPSDSAGLQEIPEKKVKNYDYDYPYKKNVYKF